MQKWGSIGPDRITCELHKKENLNGGASVKPDQKEWTKFSELQSSNHAWKAKRFHTM